MMRMRTKSMLEKREMRRSFRRINMLYVKIQKIRYMAHSGFYTDEIFDVFGSRAINLTFP